MCIRDRIETLCGPYKSPFSIERALTGCNINYFDLPEFQFPAFTRGQYGTYKLLGDDRVPGMVKNTQGGTRFAMYKRQEAQHYDHIKPISHYKFSMDEKLALLDLIVLTAEEHKLTEKLDRKVNVFKIAVSATASYTEFWGDNNESNGSNKQDAYAAIVSTINRVNEVFETDLGIRLELVCNVSLIFDGRQQVFSWSLE